MCPVKKKPSHFEISVNIKHDTAGVFDIYYVSK